MLYVKDKDALIEKFYDNLEELQGEPLGDPVEYLSVLGRHIWGVWDDTYSIYYDEKATIEAVLVREDIVFYIITDGHNVFIDPAEEVPLTKEEAIAYRNKRIDAMDWSGFFKSIQYNLKDHPQWCKEFLDIIRPIYKEMVWMEE